MPMKTILELLHQEHLSLHAPEIFVRRESRGHMPLILERLFNPPPSPAGATLHLSLSHTYLQNSDVMFDPEVTFAIYKRTAFPGLESLGIIERDDTGNDWLFVPTSVRMDNIADYLLSFSGPSPEALLVSISGQRAKCLFCREWDQNLHAQGFLCAP